MEYNRTVVQPRRVKVNLEVSIPIRSIFIKNASHRGQMKVYSVWMWSPIKILLVCRRRCT